ncbi:MAG: hypothetical protein HYU33_00225 [Candidatus Omnitrophica bacterium]|nr:hypothetical protein [Candidatus Omnitrophota bacterium]
MASFSLPILQAISGQSGREVLLGAVLGLLLVIRHSDNIVRLLQGTEHRFESLTMDELLNIIGARP